MGRTASAAPRDAAFWASYVERLEVADVPQGAVDLNVRGRRVTSPIQGFGRLWRKTYAIRLDAALAGPEEVVRVWKERFGEFWPGRNRFLGSLAGLAPGDVGLITLNLGGLLMRTGVLVLYADDSSFTVMTPQGHQFAGFNTFSARRDGGTTVIEIEALVRASDPLYELGLPFVGHPMEDWFWTRVLRALAANFGATGEVERHRVCLDRRRQWQNWANIWHNAAIRSAIYLAMAPLRAVRRAASRARCSAGHRRAGACVAVIARRARDGNRNDAPFGDGRGSTPPASVRPGRTG